MHNKTALDYGRQGADTFLRRWPVEELPPAGRFHYHQGVFLSGLDRIYGLCGEKSYDAYLKAWLDQFIDGEGNLRGSTLDQFDDMQPAILLFRYYRETGDERYRAVLDRIAGAVDRWPTNALGGFWHKMDRENQMWLDTLYMIGPFMAMYAEAFHKPYFFEKVFHQMALMRDHMTDRDTGLLRHAWDDSRRMPWADAAAGLSPECWGRAMGWYTVAVLDILEHLPPDHPHRGEFIRTERDFLEALLRYQDREDGRWYQVLNRGDDPDNWLENSCSCLYCYSLAKACRLGLAAAPTLETWREAAGKAYAGVIRSLELEDQAGGEDLIIPGICIGTGVGDYRFYLTRPTVKNDLHGMGAFLLMCSEYYAAFPSEGGG